MNKVLVALVPLMMAFNTVSAEFFLKLKEFNRYTKNSSTIENLDTKNFKGTNYTSFWKSNKQFSAYGLGAEVLWEDACTNFYAKVSGYYGWVTDGRTLQSPLRWDVEGHVDGFGIEAGYVMDVCQRFQFIPHIGYAYDITHTHLKHQHEYQRNPSTFISQNGNKTTTDLWFPYIGFELDFSTPLCDCHELQLSFLYELGYGGGDGSNKVHHFIATDDPNTSRYGSHIKYRDMISHDFEIAAAYNLSDYWQIALELDYINIYNTHSLPVKFQKNKKLVKAGQFTPSQYHSLSDDNTHTYAITLELTYNFSGKSGAFVR